MECKLGKILGMVIRTGELSKAALAKINGMEMENYPFLMVKPLKGNSKMTKHMEQELSFGMGQKLQEYGRMERKMIIVNLLHVNLTLFI